MKDSGNHLEEQQSWRDRAADFAEADRTEEFQPAGDQEDDGRVIANMNVEGMPWYRKEEGAAGTISRRRMGEGRPRTESWVSDAEPEKLTRSQTGQFIRTALLTALLIAGVFSAVIILFVLFCTKIWFA